MLRVFSHEMATVEIPRCQPGRNGQKKNVSREAVTVFKQAYLLPSLRGSTVCFSSFPWAYAQGYLLPSLRDSASTQHQ